ncbi:VTT domain-containing protein [Bacillus sp. ISL-39]|uniref:TVP38/TMEM64 family protein n=1 Tax=Bacillus sp. ISL-39 TaxID=2819124 RepID=UPI001BE74873|nr:VTT domain-containing protein [Bacillus sp. ISL-39]MBT2638583.1 TVP38/TMEM64 family protein [Bacillus sp. ISL-39]
MKKWFIVIAYIIILTAGFYNRELILGWIQTSDPSQLPLMMFFSALFASIPIIPFTIFAGLMGAKYGLLLGLLINWFGSVTAAVVYFFLARSVLREYFRSSLHRFSGIQKFQTMLLNNAFISILFSRMVAIIPPLVVNVYSGMANIPLRTFLTATALGKLPPMFIFAYAGEQVFYSIKNLALGLFFYLLFLLSVLFIYRAWSLRYARLE